MVKLVAPAGVVYVGPEKLSPPGTALVKMS